MGRSIGSGVATYLASERQVRGVILITPYDSIQSVAQEKFPWLPVSLLPRNTFFSVDFAQKQPNPALVIYGGQDTTIPPHHTKNLIDHWSGAVTEQFIPDANHDDILDHEATWSAIRGFISL